MKTTLLFTLVVLLTTFTAALGQTTPSGNATNDAELVRKVIETETLAYHEAKFDLNKQQWSNSPYTERQHVELKPYVGVPYAKGEKLFQLHDAYGKTAKPTGNKSRLTDYDAHISGNTAWATYTQEMIDATGAVVDKQRGVRILERGSDGWKIVFMSQHKL